MDCLDACPGFDDLMDGDGDGVPDECDTCKGADDNIDCNVNGVPDPCEILHGQADDTDGNGIPDECDIAPVSVALGGRYLTVTPAAGNEALALRFTSPDFPCLSLYVDQTGALVDLPVQLLPSQWGTVLIHDEIVVPSVTYDIHAEFVGGLTSAPGRTTLWQWATWTTIASPTLPTPSLSSWLSRAISHSRRWRRSIFFRVIQTESPTWMTSSAWF